MTADLSDQEEVRAIRAGDVVAFRKVFDACYDSLCKYAFTILRDIDEAEDIVQSIFTKVWEKREELEIHGAMRSYLFRSVYNQCMNLVEHRTVRQKHYEYSQWELIRTVQPEVFVDELDEKIRQAIDTLPTQCRTIFIMSRYEELRYPEIAKKLNISVNTIQNQICKALRILRNELKDSID